MIYSHENPVPRPSGPRPTPPSLERGLWDAMEMYIKERGLNFQLAKTNQWYPTLDPQKVGRIVIPCSNSEGLSYWQARAMIDSETTLRYTSPWASREDSIVVCWPTPSPETPGGVVVEGPFDALGAAECGRIGIGIMGNKPPLKVMLKVAYLLRGLSAVVVPDVDAPEFGAMAVVALAAQGVKVKMLVPPRKDLAAMPLEERCALLSL